MNHPKPSHPAPPTSAAAPRDRSLTRRLVAKDLYFYRWLIAAALVAGIGSLTLYELTGGSSASGLNVGGVLFLTTIITFGIFIPMFGILKESEERSRLFVLSLPVSPGQYARIKVLAALLAFLMPWLVITVGAVLTTFLLGGPRGGLPLFLAIMGLFLCNFCLLTAVVACTMSERWSIVAILVTNLSVTLFLAKVSALPGVGGHTRDATATFGSAISMVLAGEVALILLSLFLALYLPSRQHDLG